MVVFFFLIYLVSCILDSIFYLAHPTIFIFSTQATIISFFHWCKLQRDVVIALFSSVCDIILRDSIGKLGCSSTQFFTVLILQW